ncbi:hypothetical protein [Vibrio bathopelagicus]
MIGQRFSMVYLNRDEPARDNTRFRNRLKAFYWDELHLHFDSGIKSRLQKEAGIEIPFIGSSFCVPEVFSKNDIRDVLDSITLIYQSLRAQNTPKRADNWKTFVGRALREENVGYQLDEQCGVHYFVDEEFERNRASTLIALNNPDHLGVKAAYEDAYRHMDSTPPDTKASARSIFEAIEIITKLLVKTNNLNKYILENDLQNLALKALAPDDTQKEVISGMFNGMGLWVNAMHKYRHGQAKEEAVAPSEELAVYMLSTGSAFLRLLLEVWKVTKQ